MNAGIPNSSVYEKRVALEKDLVGYSFVWDAQAACFSLHLPASHTSLNTQFRHLIPVSRTFLESLPLQDPFYVATCVAVCTLSSRSPH